MTVGLIPVLVVLGTAGLAVLSFVLLRRGRAEGEKSSRAALIGCGLLAVLIVAGIALLVHALRQPGGAPGEVEIHIRAPGAELFLDERHIATGEALLLASEGTSLGPREWQEGNELPGGEPLGKIDGRTGRYFASRFPGSTVLDVRFGAILSVDSGGVDAVITMLTVLLRTPEGTLDSVAAVFIDTPSESQERRLFLLRARSGANRFLWPGGSSVGYSVDSLIDCLSGRRSIPRCTLDLSTRPLPAEHRAEGREPVFIVDGYAVPAESER
jgi:hypothetical protein